MPMGKGTCREHPPHTKPTGRTPRGLSLVSSRDPNSRLLGGADIEGALDLTEPHFGLDGRGSRICPVPSKWALRLVTFSLPACGAASPLDIASLAGVAFAASVSWASRVCRDQ